MKRQGTMQIHNAMQDLTVHTGTNSIQSFQGNLCLAVIHVLYKHFNFSTLLSAVSFVIYTHDMDTALVG